MVGDLITGISKGWLIMKAELKDGMAVFICEECNSEMPDKSKYVNICDQCHETHVYIKRNKVIGFAITKDLFGLKTPTLGTIPLVLDVETDGLINSILGTNDTEVVGVLPAGKFTKKVWGIKNHKSYSLGFDCDYETKTDEEWIEVFEERYAYLTDGGQKNE